MTIDQINTALSATCPNKRIARADLQAWAHGVCVRADLGISVRRCRKMIKAGSLTLDQFCRIENPGGLFGPRTRDERAAVYAWCRLT